MRNLNPRPLGKSLPLSALCSGPGRQALPSPHPGLDPPWELRLPRGWEGIPTAAPQACLLSSQTAPISPGVCVCVRHGVQISCEQDTGTGTVAAEGAGDSAQPQGSILLEPLVLSKRPRKHALCPAWVSELAPVGLGETKDGHSLWVRHKWFSDRVW